MELANIKYKWLPAPQIGFSELLILSTKKWPDHYHVKKKARSVCETGLSVSRLVVVTCVNVFISITLKGALTLGKLYRAQACWPPKSSLFECELYAVLKLG